MIKTLTLFLALTCFLIPRFVFSAAFDMGERIQINSSILKEPREIQILLPESYRSHGDATYPVIYLLDGDYTFQGVAGMLDFMANKAQMIPDVILVGIADKGTDKYRQYMTPAELTAPFEENDLGKAKQFLNFLENEVKTYINTHYRAANNSTLVGHSIGGLFVLNALFESPNAFENFVSTSPAVWLNDHGIMEKADTFVKNSKHEPVSLFVSVGDETRQGVFGVVQLLDEVQPQNIKWHFSHYPDENHNATGVVALRSDLKTIFNGWYLSDKDLSYAMSANSLLAHYKALTQALGVAQAIPTPSIKSAIRYFYKQEKTDEIPAFMAKVAHDLPASEQGFIIMLASYVAYVDSQDAALDMLLKSEARYNHSVEYIKSIASTYEKLDKHKKALDYYEKALELATKYENNQWQINILEAKILENQ